jgi:hypothetical protein
MHAMAIQPARRAKCSRLLNAWAGAFSAPFSLSVLFALMTSGVLCEVI